MKCIHYLFKAFLVTLCLPLIVSSAEISTRIVGGQESDIGEFPWAVSLKYSETQTHFCGGSLIGKQWVLTAAHCLVDMEPTLITATIGEYYLDSDSDSDSGPLTIEQFYIHPDFNSTTQDNDIALLKLVSAVDNPSFITPVNLADTIDAVASEANVTALGWGSIVPPDNLNYPDYPNILNYVEMPLMTDTMCSSALGDDYSAETICAGLEEGGKDSCQGDSGSPLVIEQGSGWQQIGIASWGYGCAAPGYPGVYTRLALYDGWIESVSNSLYFPDRLEFKDTLVATSSSKTVVIENNSTENAQLTFTASGADTFSYDASDCLYIDRNDNCELLVSYRPFDTNPSQKTIRISSNVINSIQTLSLIGLPLIIGGSGGGLGWLSVLLFPLLFIRHFYKFSSY